MDGSDKQIKIELSTKILLKESKKIKLQSIKKKIFIIIIYWSLSIFC